MCVCLIEQGTSSHYRRLSGAAHNPMDVPSQPKRIDLNTENDSRVGEVREMKDRMKMGKKWRGTEVSWDISWI